ncbi:hypothetical protein D3C72_1496920 [compost metagenome]
MQEIMRGACGDLPADQRLRIRIGKKIRRQQRIGMAEHMIGKTEGKRRLADPLRPLDQNGVMALAGAIGLREKRFRLFMAKKLRVLLWRNRAVENALNLTHAPRPLLFPAVQAKARRRTGHPPPPFLPAGRH